MNVNRLDRKPSCGYVIGTALMVILAIITTYPFIWMLFSSFKLDKEIVIYPPSLFGEEYTLENYQKIWARLPFFRYYLNTIIFAGGTTIISLLLDSSSQHQVAHSTTMQNDDGMDFLLMK